MRKLLSRVLLIVTLCCVCFVGTAYAAEDTKSDGVDVRVNGYLVEFPDKKPYVNSDSRTLIPVRFVAEALGADVSWNGQRKAAQIETDDLMILLPAGTNKMEVTRNGKTTTKILDTTTIVEEGRTMIPIRAVAEEMGCWVSFSGAYNTVEIYCDSVTAAEMQKVYDMNVYTANWWGATASDYVGSFMNVGRYKMENLSENAIRTVKDGWKIIPGAATGRSGSKFDFVSDSSEDFISFLVDEAKYHYALSYSSEKYGVTATCRTNEGLVFADPENELGSHNYHVISYITLTFAPNADVNKYFEYKYLGAADASQFKAGESYTFILDGLWTPNANGQWSSKKVQNITNNINSGDWW